MVSLPFRPAIHGWGVTLRPQMGKGGRRIGLALLRVGRSAEGESVRWFAFRGERGIAVYPGRERDVRGAARRSASLVGLAAGRGSRAGWNAFTELARSWIDGCNRDG